MPVLTNKLLSAFPRVTDTTFEDLMLNSGLPKLYNIRLIIFL